ncbi:unnamed protein product [Discula destructiva]
MKLRRTLRFHSLRKGKVRMTWNKYNLYNLANVDRKIPNFIRRTFFQQKWTAKAMTRAYHGEHIKEQKWTRMFDRRLRSVVDMNPEYMAHNDGAEQATGRGSGRDTVTPEDVAPWVERGQSREWKLQGGRGLNEAFKPLVDMAEVNTRMGLEQRLDQTNTQLGGTGRTPYMNMSFAPIERRIDVAMFRAMFASSTRQARNLVIHGKVKVNGQPMNHATYLLNPGDMFQVEPDAVMFATGKIKTKADAQQQSAGAQREPRKRKAKKANTKNKEEEASDEAAAAPEADEGSLEPAEGAEDAQEVTGTSPEEVQRRLRLLARNARRILALDADELGVKNKQRLRAFMKRAKNMTSQLGRKDGESAVTTDLMATIKEAFEDMVLHDTKFAAEAEQSGAFSAEEAADAVEAAESASGGDDAAAAKKAEGKEAKPKRVREPMRELNDEEKQRLEELVREYEDNPVDHSKPYKTPWEPRPFMSPFAFIPRYLEVNQNICAAVYLRHPVARQGMAEIPSPFPPAVQELAFNWYLRRR